METDSPPMAPEADAPAASRTLPWWPAVLTVVAMSAWPFLQLLASNPDVPIDLPVVRGWWLAMLTPSLVVLGLAMLVGRRPGRWVGGMLGVLLWLLWSMPTALAIRDTLGVSLSNGRWWVVFATVVLLAAALPMRTAGMQRFVAVVSVALAVSALAPLAISAATGDGTPPVARDGSEEQTTTDPAGSFARSNDVWFIALDGLAGSGLLRDLGYDSSPFEDELRSAGFTVQEQATSNYPFTNLSLSSTLSMEYTWERFEEPTQGPFFLHMSGGNAWVELVRANGYGYAHAFPGFYNGSRCAGLEDVCVGESSAITDTDTALAELTPFGRWILATSEQADIAAANDPAQQVARVLSADLPSPAYHFVHSLNPHPPILRDADCDVREVRLRLGDWGEGPEYVDAVRCLHRQLLQAVDLITAADPEAIVVLQGDHGPRLGLDFDENGAVTLADDEFFDILSAIRLPDACDDIVIPDDLTPVNTLRIVRACLEDRQPDLLENRRFPIRRDRD